MYYIYLISSNLLQSSKIPLTFFFKKYLLKIILEKTIGDLRLILDDNLRYLVF